MMPVDGKNISKVACVQVREQRNEKQMEGKDKVEMQCLKLETLGQHSCITQVFVPLWFHSLVSHRMHWFQTSPDVFL